MTATAIAPIVIASGIPGYTWDGASGHDIGAAINAAIALANPGAEILLPAGTFYFSTPIVHNNSGVSIKARGLGNFNGGSAVTELIWNGSAGQSPAFFVGPASGGTPINSVDLDGLVVNGNGLADVGIAISSVCKSRISVGGKGCRKTDVWITTQAASGSGTQDNDFSLWSYETTGAYNATGILIDGAGGWSHSPSWGNVSLNRFHYLYATHAGGDGIVVGFADTNKFYDIRTSRSGSATTGTPVVFANDTYTPPSGVPVAGYTYDNIIFSAGAPIYFAGSTQNSTWTENGGNAGSAHLAPVTVSTNAATSVNSNILNFASLSGVAQGMSVKAGGASSGLYPNSLVLSVTGTTATISNRGVAAGGGISGVASGVSCTFSYGMTSTAVAGTYTLTATGASTYNLTAPAGGNSQTGVTLSGGVLTFKDMVIPMSGSAVNGDSWTIVVPTAATKNMASFIDKANNISDPWFEPPSWGSFTSPYSPMPTVAGLQPYGLATQQVALAGGSNYGPVFSYNFATGAASAIYGGTGHNTSGFASGAIFGFNHNVSGFAASAHGGNTYTLSGTCSASLGGQHGNDRGRYNVQVFSSGKFSAQGDAQTATHLLRGTGATGSAFRLTADQAAAGSANTVNIPNNTAYLVTVDVMAFDSTTVTKNEVWTKWTGLLTRGANAASTALTMESTPTPISNGTVTGSAIAATADTTNGGMNISFTPPTGNTDTWHVVARVTTVEVQ